jgi:LPS export ABC transporter permease LptG
VAPYIILAFLLLTALLFAQQTGRFAEILVTSKVPLSLFADVSAALVPSVLVFTIPMGVLAGMIIGFSRLGSDSELVAIRNAGVGTWSLLWPALLLGLLATLATAYMNLQAAPRSAAMLRQAGVEAAIAKLNSPIEPRSFTLDMPGYVAYVRDGDKIKGEWGRIFIYSGRKEGGSLVVTGKTGRLDTTGDKTELVLADSIATQLPASDNDKNESFVVEHTDNLRFSFDTGRKDLISKLQNPGTDIDEADLLELVARTHSAEPKTALEATAYLHKRLSLAIAPLLFSLLGTAIGLRIRKGGRAFGVFLSIILMLGYYLLSLVGDQSARAGTIHPIAGAWFATTATLIFSLLLLLTTGKRTKVQHYLSLRSLIRRRSQVRDLWTSQKGRRARHFSGFPMLLDSGVIRSLTLSFAVSVATLVSIFLIFTLFELWRFVAASRSGLALVAEYLVFLVPFLIVQIMPAATLIAVLATYALMARRSESIAWWASGQSVYRLFLPGMVFGVMVSAATWYVQESVMPSTNIRQDALRAQLKKTPQTATANGKQWLASIDSQRLYTFVYSNRAGEIEKITVFEFEPSGTHLSRIIRAESAHWDANDRISFMDAEVLDLDSRLVKHEHFSTFSLDKAEPYALFKPAIDKPSQLNTSALSAYIQINKQRGLVVAGLLVALYKKYSDPLGPVIMTLLAAPLALAFGRRNVVAGLCVAIMIGIAYWGVSGGCQQLGAFGMLPAAVAAFAPLVIFGSAGLYLLSKTKT